MKLKLEDGVPVLQDGMPVYQYDDGTTETIIKNKRCVNCNMELNLSKYYDDREYCSKCDTQLKRDLNRVLGWGNYSDRTHAELIRRYNNGDAEIVNYIQWVFAVDFKCHYPDMQLSYDLFQRYCY